MSAPTHLTHCPLCGAPIVRIEMEPVRYEFKGGREPGRPPILMPGRQHAICEKGHST